MANSELYEKAIQIVKAATNVEDLVIHLTEAARKSDAFLNEIEGDFRAALLADDLGFDGWPIADIMDRVKANLQVAASNEK